MGKIRASAALIVLVGLAILPGCIDIGIVIPTPTRAPSSRLGIERGNVQPTGVYSSAGTPQLNSILWKYTPESEAYISPPVIADGVAYITTNAGIAAIDAQTGLLQWKMEVDSYSYPPTVVNGVVYHGGKDALHAMDAKSRQEKWKFEIEDDISAHPPLFYDGIVYFGDRKGIMYAVDANTGQQKWQAKVGDYTVSSPAASNGILYFLGGLRPIEDGQHPRHQSNIYAVDIKTGQQKWNFQAPGDANEQKYMGDPIIADGRVYSIRSFPACCGWDPVDHLYALDASTGKELWKFKRDWWFRTNYLAASNGLVYVAIDKVKEPALEPPPDATLYALDGRTGEEKWSFQLGESFTAPSIADGIVYVANNTGGKGVIYALDAATGVEQHKLELDQEISSPAAIADGVIYVIVDQNTLVAIQ